MLLGAGASSATDIEFNTDILDLNDRTNIDLSRFSRSGFILPGTYPMSVEINKQRISGQYRVAFYPPDDNPRGSEACVSPELVMQLGLKEKMEADLAWWKTRQCLDLASLPGMEVSGDLGTSTLYVSVPHAYLQYSAQNWDPPSRWDEGVSGLLFDYNLTAQSIQDKDASRNDIAGNGSLGANLGAWRLRADWQGRVGDDRGRRGQSIEWNRFYAYRALPALQARLMLGESYLYSDLFDSFRFTGASLGSDDSQLPPNLRGYAPEVVGVAKTNARVVISQQGRVLYSALVAAGPFRIQDLSDAVTGTLDVRVEEQDGSVDTFKVESANVPYLTRPGTVRYKLATGRPSRSNSGGDGNLFGTGEFSWGISNGWSLYGGGITDNNYRSLALGVGRDLLAFGAASFDVSRAQATPREETLAGTSYRLSYSKNFVEYDSQVTFAGYRFAEKDYLSMTEYLDARTASGPLGGSKAMYTATFNKHFRDAGFSIYLNYSNQSYWDRPSSEHWNLSLAHYFNLGTMKNMNLSLNMSRTQESGRPRSDSLYVSLSLPLGNSGSLINSINRSRDRTAYSTRFSDRLNERTTYQLSASDTSVGGFLSHIGDRAEVDLSAGMEQNNHTSLGLSARGGATLTANGGALHRSASMGGTRLILDTAGIPDVPVRGYGVPTRSNAYGKAVLSDISSYHRAAASVDLESLPANIEAIRSVTELTLTEGAIGYRTLDVISGEKAMALLRLPDGSVPPFGATVTNPERQETGIVNDEGSVYLSGIQPGEQMIVSWSGRERCIITLPIALPADGLTSTLDLLCQTPPADKALSASASLSPLNDMKEKSL